VQNALLKSTFFARFYLADQWLNQFKIAEKIYRNYHYFNSCQENETMGSKCSKPSGSQIRCADSAIKNLFFARSGQIWPKTDRA